jgi:hypothetical protein
MFRPTETRSPVPGDTIFWVDRKRANGLAVLNRWWVHGCKDSRDRKVERGFKAARKQYVLEIERLMVCYNHPVSADWLIVIILKVWEKRPIGWLQKSFLKALFWSCLF